jgi:hypothetical protein
MAVSPLSINEFIGTGATCAVEINLVVPIAIGAFDRAAFLSAAELKGLNVVLVASTYLPAFQRMDAMDANQIADTIGCSDRQGWVLTMLGTYRYSLSSRLPS